MSVEKISFNPEIFKSFCGDDPEQEKTMINMFIEQSQAYLAQMHEAYDLNCLDDWHDTAHKFKGMASFAGAEKLYDLCQAAQFSNDASDFVYKSMIEAIENETNNAIQSIISYRER
jgi:HPt (histidine-containing phosphotransfer) domain-containing protein